MLPTDWNLFLLANKDIKINFTGLRPGEKILEELHYKNEKFLKFNLSK